MTPPTPREFPRLPAVVLAAGRSVRMGSIKALLPWPATRQPFVVHVASTLREAGASPVAVVTGAHHERVAAVLAGAEVPALFNARHEEGQLASLQHGLAWAFAQGGADWVMVTLVDVPGVRVETVRQLLATTVDTPALALRPAIGGRHGHPVMWRRDALPLVLAADPAQGGRAVMHALAAAGQVLDVPVDDTGVLLDIDEPADLEKLPGSFLLP